MDKKESRTKLLKSLFQHEMAPRKFIEKSSKNNLIYLLGKIFQHITVQNLKSHFQVMSFLMIMFMTQVNSKNAIQEVRESCLLSTKEKSTDSCTDATDLNWNPVLNPTITVKTVWDFVDNQSLKLTEFHQWKVFNISTNVRWFFVSRWLTLVTLIWFIWNLRKLVYLLKGFSLKDKLVSTSL